MRSRSQIERFSPTSTFGFRSIARLLPYLLVISQILSTISLSLTITVILLFSTDLNTVSCVSAVPEATWVHNDKFVNNHQIYHNVESFNLHDNIDNYDYNNINGIGAQPQIYEGPISPDFLRKLQTTMTATSTVSNSMTNTQQQTNSNSNTTNNAAIAQTLDPSDPNYVNPLNKVFTATHDETVAPFIDTRGKYDPCNGNRPPETFEEIEAERKAEEDASNERAALIGLIFELILWSILIPGVIIPVMGGLTPLSFPFAGIYKLRVLDPIPEDRFKVHLVPNPNILDLEFPWFSFTEDVQTFLHACCCYIPRISQTYAAADLAPFWMVFKKAVVYGPLAPIFFAEYRWTLRNKMGLARTWEDLTIKEQRLYMAEACCCWSCYAYQEAKQVDTAAGITVICCCNLVDIWAEEAEAKEEGLALNIESITTQHQRNTLQTQLDRQTQLQGPGGRATAASQFQPPMNLVGGAIRATQQYNNNMMIQDQVTGKDSILTAALTKENIEILEETTVAPGIGERLPDEQQSITSRVFQDTREKIKKEQPQGKGQDDDVASNYSRRSGAMFAGGLSRQHSETQSETGDGPEQKKRRKKKKEANRQLSANQIRNPRKPIGILAGGNLSVHQMQQNSRIRANCPGPEQDPYTHGSHKYELQKASRQSQLLQIPNMNQIGGGNGGGGSNSARSRGGGGQGGSNSARSRISMSDQNNNNLDSGRGSLRQQQSFSNLNHNATNSYGNDKNIDDDMRSVTSRKSTSRRSWARASRTGKSQDEDSETTLTSEMASTAFNKQQNKEMRKKQKQAGKSFFDDADAVSEASTKAKRIARARLPQGRLTAKQFRRLNEVKIQKLFLECDREESGFITFDDFKEFLDRRFGVRPRDAVLQDLLLIIDENSDGMISEEEFVKFFQYVLQLTNEIRGANDFKWKQNVLSNITNIVAFLVFLCVFIGGTTAANECEEICRDEEIACVGQTRQYCTFKCLEPKQLDKYMQHGLMTHLLFHMSIAALMALMIIQCCVPGCVKIMVLCCFKKKQSEAEQQANKIAAENDPDQDQTEALSAERLALAVKERHALAPDLNDIRFPVPEDYKRAIKDQQLLDMVRQNQTFNPMAHKMQNKIFDPRTKDPLSMMELEYDNPDELLEDLDRNPLKPIAWLPPGLAEDFVTNVIKIDEEEERRLETNKQEVRMMKKQIKIKEALGQDTGLLKLELEPHLARKTQNLAIKDASQEKSRKTLMLKDAGAIDTFITAAGEEADGLAFHQTTHELQMTLALSATASGQKIVPMTIDEEKRAAAYQTEVYNQPQKLQTSAENWNQWERDFRAQERSNARKRVNNMLSAAKDSEQYKRAVEIAKQHTVGNVVQAFDEDDIRRLERRLREMKKEEEEQKNSLEVEIQQCIRNIQISMQRRDPILLEENLPKMKGLITKQGGRKHARFLFLAEKELYPMQKEAEQKRVAMGGSNLDSHWSKFKVKEEGEGEEGERKNEEEDVEGEE